MMGIVRIESSDMVAYAWEKDKLRVFRRIIIQDLRKETREDFRVKGTYIAKRIRIVKDSLHVFQLLVKIEDMGFIDLYTAGLSEQGMKEVGNIAREAFKKDTATIEVMWKLFNGRELKEEEKAIALKRLEEYKKSSAIEEEDYQYYKEVLLCSKK